MARFDFQVGVTFGHVLGTFFVITAGGLRWYYWHLVDRGQDAPKHYHMHGAVPHNSFLATNVNSVQVRKP